VQRVQGVPAARPEQTEPNRHQAVAGHQGARGPAHEARHRRQVRERRSDRGGARAQGGHT